MNGKQLRTLTRIIHVVGSILLGVFIYSPLGNQEWFSLLMQFGVMPLLGITGLVMWQQARVLKWLNGRGTATRSQT